MLLEIVDSLISITVGDRVNAMLKMKKCIRRFREAYLEDYCLKGGTERVRVKGMMLVGYICSMRKSFPLCEKTWRMMHDYRRDKGREYFVDFPDDRDAFAEKEEFRCGEEINAALKDHPMEECSDYVRLVEAFDAMRHLAHLGSYDPNHPDEQFIEMDREKWYDVNPWRLPRGKSMLVDYWYNIPLELRPVGHAVLDRLASSQIKSTEDLLKLRREVEAW